MKTQMTPEQITRLIGVLEGEWPTHKAKDRRMQQRQAAHAKRSNYGNKVSKGMRLDLCTQGGRLSNRFNDSGRTKLGKEGIQLLMLDETGYPSYEEETEEQYFARSAREIHAAKNDFDRMVEVMGGEYEEIE
jgi:hypothetical protein